MTLDWQRQTLFEVCPSCKSRLIKATAETFELCFVLWLQTFYSRSVARVKLRTLEMCGFSCRSEKTMFREVSNVKAENLLILTPEEKSDPNNSLVPLRWVLPQHVVILGVVLLNTTDLIYLTDTKGGVFLKKSNNMNLTCPLDHHTTAVCL